MCFMKIVILCKIRFFCQGERRTIEVKSWTLTRQTVPSFSSLISLVVLQIRTISEVHLKRIPSSDFYTHTLVEITARISPRIIRKGVRKIGSQNYFILLQEE